MRTTVPLATREGKPERGQLLVVSNQQDVANKYRVVPGLTLDRRESCELSEPVGSRIDQRQLTLLCHHQQQVLIGQQDELAGAVTATFPFALSVLGVDAREDAAVEAEGVAFVNNEVAELGT